MGETPRDPKLGRTSWRRFAAALVPTIGGAAALVTLVANGAVAASLSLSGSDFQVAGTTLDGVGFVQYGDIDQRVNGEVVPVATAAMKSATITNLCQSVVTKLPIIGAVSVEIHAGDEAGKPVTATNLFIDLKQLEGDATFTNIEIGRDASKLDKGPVGGRGHQDLFGQQADSVHIDNFKQVAVLTNAGTFKLNGLSLKVTKGEHPCF